ncbi:helix-turn-helix domain-containing protein [Nocardia sp. CA-290969]|uniref:helix-turn-helix domain-containing protein n=1 Tax=Nocardia sp. CA-290969 TaxID=3239986 RepID=UPI003D90CDCA
MATVGVWTGTEVQALRLALRMNQAEFAALVGVRERSVRRWEKHESPVGRFNANVLDGLLAEASEQVLGAYRRIRDRIAGEEDTDVNRRTLFKSSAAGAAALAALGLSGDAAERISWLMSGTGRPDMHGVDLVRGTLHQAMLLDDAMGSPAAQGMVIAQQALTEAMVKEAAPALRPHLVALDAEMIGFAGCLAWDVGDRVTANRLYGLARDKAHDADDSDIRAYMHCHLSQLALADRRTRDAVNDAIAARAAVSQSSDHRLRAYVEMRVAEAAATDGQGRFCAAALNAAEKALELAHAEKEVGPERSRAYFATSALLESYRGWCWSLLGEPDRAVEATRAAVAMIDPRRTRDRAMMLLELERAYLQLGDIAGAAAAVSDALDLTDRNRSPRLATAIMQGRQLLTPWGNSSPVRELDAALTARDMVLV